MGILVVESHRLQVVVARKLAATPVEASLAVEVREQAEEVEMVVVVMVVVAVMVEVEMAVVEMVVGAMEGVEMVVVAMEGVVMELWVVVERVTKVEVKRLVSAIVVAEIKAVAAVIKEVVVVMAEEEEVAELTLMEEVEMIPMVVERQAAAEKARVVAETAEMAAKVVGSGEETVMGLTQKGCSEKGKMERAIVHSFQKDIDTEDHSLKILILFFHHHSWPYCHHSSA